MIKEQQTSQQESIKDQAHVQSLIERDVNNDIEIEGEAIFAKKRG